MENSIIERSIIERSIETQCELIERNGKEEITGYGAVVFDGSPGTEYQLADNLWERFAPGAFDKYLASGNNIEIRFNHSSDFVLGDTQGAARCTVDEKGLRYSVPFDSTDPDHIKVRCKLQKGLIKGSSIAGVPQYRFEDQAGKHIAWITSMRSIRDVGPVGTPAYKAAPAMMRSDDLDQQYKNWLLKQETEKRVKKYRDHTK